jgi:predicted RNase H-like HicB family nuclease
MNDLTEKAREYAALDYETVIEPDTCGAARCYVARNPEFPGCMSHGSTQEEAVANLRDARELYILTLLEDGLEVPRPRLSPAPV